MTVSVQTETCCVAGQTPWSLLFSYRLLAMCQPCTLYVWGVAKCIMRATQQLRGLRGMQVKGLGFMELGSYPDISQSMTQMFCPSGPFLRGVYHNVNCRHVQLTSYTQNLGVEQSYKLPLQHRRPLGLSCSLHAGNAAAQTEAVLVVSLRAWTHLHESDAAAVQIGHRHAQQLSAALQVPDADLSQATGSKDFTVLVGEGHIMHTAGGGCLQHLCLQLLALHTRKSCMWQTFPSTSVTGEACFVPRLLL